MVEAIANSIEDYLIDGLSFKLRPGASYVIDRQSVTFHPQGSNIYRPNGGTKLIKINLTGDNWLDPSTVKVMFDLRNMAIPIGAGPLLRPLGAPYSFFRRMRVLVNGAIVEDIDNFNRVSELFSILSPKDYRINEDMEGFGKTYDHGLPNPITTIMNSNTYTGIGPSKAQTVLFTPLSGLLKQKKFIPLRYASINFELELVDNMTDPIIRVSNNFSISTTTDNWQIENVQLKADVCTLDNALDNSYAQYLLSGKSLAINFNTYISQLQSMISAANIGQKAIRLNVTRSLSRLKSIFVTLIAPPIHADYVDSLAVIARDWNYFYSPMFNTSAGSNSGDLKHDESDEFEAQIQIGSKQFPVYPIRSHAEAFSQLMKTMGISSNKSFNFDINPHEYRTIKFVWATDTEKVIEAGFTGYNTMAGDNISISFTHKSSIAANYAVGMQIILHADCIMEIRDSGVEVSM